jgi:hypothetical protein
MTLEKLLDCSAAELKAMSDSQLLEWFKDKLTAIRPELAPRDTKPSSIRSVREPIVSKKQSQKQKAMEIARSLGIELNL